MYATSPSWSMHRKYQPSKIQSTPSPGGYYPQKWNTNHSPSWKIGNDSRNKQNYQQKPGPGQYESCINDHSKFGKFNKQNRNHGGNNQTPAPNAYSPNYKVNRPSSPYSTMPSKPKPDKPALVPGPGQYQTNINVKSRPKSGKMGLQKRFFTQKNEGPGPQAYSPIKDNFKKVYISFTKFSKQANIYHMNQQAKTPGPGTYNANTDYANCFKNNRGYSISSKHKTAPGNDNPGPGQYDPNYIFHPQDPKVSFKGKHEGYKIEDTPGPAHYFSTSMNMKNKQQGYSIGRSQRLKTDACKTNPGPGSYNPISKFSETPKYSIYGSRVQEPKSSSPGPGAYNPDKNVIKTRPQSAKIGRSKRCQVQLTISPGPGSYQPKQRLTTPCTSFTKQSKCKQSRQRSPGPGDYQIKQLIGQTQSYFKRA